MGEGHREARNEGMGKGRESKGWAGVAGMEAEACGVRGVWGAAGGGTIDEGVPNDIVATTRPAPARAAR